MWVMRVQCRLNGKLWIYTGFGKTKKLLMVEGSEA